MIEISIKKSHGTRVQAQAKMVYALASGPLTFEKWYKKAGVHSSTLRRYIPVLLKSGVIKTLKKREKIIERQIFALGVYTDLEAIREALNEFHRDRVSELSWEDLENHPKVGKILTRNERNGVLRLASSMHPPVKMTKQETKYYPRIAIS